MKVYPGLTSLNGVRKQRLTVKETSNCEITNCEVLDEKYRIKEFLVALLPASAASRKVTDLLFAFAFCKK